VISRYAHAAPPSSRPAPDLPDVRPSTVRGLLRSLWLEDATIADQRLHIHHLWDDPEYRPLLEPLEQKLHERGLL
jgi:hypothetical protein